MPGIKPVPALGGEATATAFAVRFGLHPTPAPAGVTISAVFTATLFDENIDAVLILHVAVINKFLEHVVDILLVLKEAARDVLFVAH